MKIEIIVKGVSGKSGFFLIVLPIELPIELPIVLPIELPIELPIVLPIELPIELSIVLPVSTGLCFRQSHGLVHPTKSETWGC